MRTRFLAIGIVALLLGLSVLTLGVQTQPAQGAVKAQDDPTNVMGMMADEHGNLPPALAFLAKLPPDQRFAHFTGATVNLTDQNGSPMVIHLTPGTVTSVSATSLAITPNGQTTTQTYGIVSNTIIHAQPAPGQIQSVVSGDKVVVATLDNSTDAMLIWDVSRMYMHHATPTAAPGTSTAPAATATPAPAAPAPAMTPAAATPAPASPTTAP